MIVAAVGDVILDAAQSGRWASAGADLPLLRADLGFANLEQTLGCRGVAADKPVILGGVAGVATDLADLGVDVVSLANNHSLDFGVGGLAATTSALDSAGIRHCGTGNGIDEALHPAVFEVAGTKVAFLAMATTVPPGWHAAVGRPGVAPVRVTTSFDIASEVLAEQPGSAPRVLTSVDPADQSRAVAAVAAARTESDVVLVSVHWGVPNGRALATFQRPLAHALVDAGADVVLGHHAHVLHGAESYRGRPIFYGLGHFVVHPGPFGQRDWASPSTAPDWFLTACASITIEDGGLVSARLLPHVLDVHGNPHRSQGRITSMILERMVDLSTPLGTRITWLDGTAIVELT